MRLGVLCNVPVVLQILPRHKIVINRTTASVTLASLDHMEGRALCAKLVNTKVHPEATHALTVQEIYIPALLALHQTVRVKHCTSNSMAPAGSDRATACICNAGWFGVNNTGCRM